MQVVTNQPDRLDQTYLFRVDREGAFAVARAAEADPDLARRVLEEGPEHFSALAAVELDVLELREDSRAASDDTADANEGVEMRLTQVAEGVRSRQFGDADVDFGVDASVVRESKEDNVERDLVKDGEHRRRRVGEEIGEDRLRV